MNPRVQIKLGIVLGLFNKVFMLTIQNGISQGPQIIKIIRRFLWALNSHFLHNYASAIHYEQNKSSCSNIFASGFYILSCTCSFLQFPIDPVIYNSFLIMLPHGSASSSYIYENTIVSEFVIENIFLGSKRIKVYIYTAIIIFFSHTS